MVPQSAASQYDDNCIFTGMNTGERQPNLMFVKYTTNILLRKGRFVMFISKNPLDLT
jgi:hypothetical protein